MSGSRWDFKTVAALGLLAAAGAAAVVAVPSARPGPTTFVGHHQYRFKLSVETSAAYQLTATFRDEAKVNEVVFLHPRSMTGEQALATPESEYAERSVLRLEVNPNSVYPAKAQEKLVEAFLFAAQKTLDEKKVPYKVAELQGAPLPGFALKIEGAKPVTQVFLKGRSLHYLFTGAGDGRPLHELLSSIEDP